MLMYVSVLAHEVMRAFCHRVPSGQMKAITICTLLYYLALTYFFRFLSSCKHRQGFSLAASQLTAIRCILMLNNIYCTSRCNKLTFCDH